MCVDFHTHLLPAVDDGSRSVAESLEMLEALRLQGVDTVVATPHFYSSKAGLEDFIDQRAMAYDLLKTACPETAPRVLLGAEVSFFRGMGRSDRIAQLCITGTKMMLIEMPFSQWGHSEVAEIQQLLDRDIMPVLAHIERYVSYQRDFTAFNEIINLPVFLQVNTEALRRQKMRRFVFKLIRQGFPIVLGTDCHNMKARRPDMETGRKTLTRKFGQIFLEQLDLRSEKLLK